MDIVLRMHSALARSLARLGHQMAREKRAPKARAHRANGRAVGT